MNTLQGSTIRNTNAVSIPGTAYAPPRGQQGLNPFCGTFYDQRFNGNHLEGIHIEPVLAIDSRSRDHNKYPNPNYYDIELKYKYKDVTKVELKFAIIPNSGYVINKANNLFYFQDREEQVEQCTYYVVELPCGDWPAENLEGPSICSILQAELNHASKGYLHKPTCEFITKEDTQPYFDCSCNNNNSHNRNNKYYKSKSKSKENGGDRDCCYSKYEVTFCKYQRKFTIRQVSGSGLFNIIFCGGVTKISTPGTVTVPIMGVDRFLFPETPIADFQKRYIARSLGHVLGFCPTNLTGCTEYTSDGVINFDRDRFVILRIPELQRVQSNSDALDGAFAVIGATKIANDFIFAKWDNDPYNTETYTKYFNPPLPNLNKLSIRFVNSDGEPFDFNCMDHLLLFDIGSLSQQTVFPVVPIMTQPPC
jgi:hypothetical protein